MEIKSFLKGEIPLSLSIFLNANSRLSIIQMNKQEMSFNEIIECVELAADLVSQLSPEQLSVYAGLIYEATMKPKFTINGPNFTMKEDMIGNDENYLKSIFEILSSYKNGGESEKEEEKIIHNFRKDIERFLKKPLNPLPPPSIEKELKVDLPKDDSPSELPVNNDFQIIPPAAQPIQTMVPPLPASDSPTWMRETNFLNFDAFMKAPTRPEQQQQEPPRPPHPIEKHEGMVRLLAYIRKGGMDLLFPQVLHEKILLIVYTAVKCVNPIAHRELMDMVTAAKDSGIINGIDNVSKTKVRGIFALLKTCLALGTINGDGESVRLFIGKGINSFRDLRERHDAFLRRCLLQLRINLPPHILGEVIWQITPDILEERLIELHNLEFALQNLYLNGQPLPNNPPPISLTSQKFDNDSLTSNLPSSFSTYPSLQQQFMQPNSFSNMRDRSSMDDNFEASRLFSKGGNQEVDFFAQEFSPQSSFNSKGFSDPMFSSHQDLGSSYRQGYHQNPHGYSNSNQWRPSQPHVQSFPQQQSNQQQFQNPQLSRMNNSGPFQSSRNDNFPFQGLNKW